MPNLDSPRDVIYVLADRWYTLKTLLELDLGLSDAVLHIVGGLVLQVACAAALRLSLKSFYPWLLVLTVQLINEAADFHFGGMIGEGSLGASVLDTALTMLLPTAMVISTRSRATAASEPTRPAHECLND